MARAKPVWRSLRPRSSLIASCTGLMLNCIATRAQMMTASKERAPAHAARLAFAFGAVSAAASLALSDACARSDPISRVQDHALAFG